MELARCLQEQLHTRHNTRNMTTPNPAPTSSNDAPACDTSLRYVRMLEQLPDGQVSFEFSIGWPELVVELILPANAFEAFCDNNKVVRLDS